MLNKKKKKAFFFFFFWERKKIKGHKLGEFSLTRKFVRHGGRMQRELEAAQKQKEIEAAQAAKAPAEGAAPAATTPKK